eukprot:575459-Pelagomonas_calceolata.AAC.1
MDGWKAGLWRSCFTDHLLLENLSIDAPSTAVRQCGAKIPVWLMRKHMNLSLHGTNVQGSCLLSWSAYPWATCSDKLPVPASDILTCQVSSFPLYAWLLSCLEKSPSSPCQGTSNPRNPTHPLAGIPPSNPSSALVQPPQAIALACTPLAAARYSRWEDADQGWGSAAQFSWGLAAQHTRWEGNDRGRTVSRGGLALYSEGGGCMHSPRHSSMLQARVGSSIFSSIPCP